VTARADVERKARREALRHELRLRIDAGDIGLVEAVRMMRKIAGKTQAEYARLVGIAPRVLIDFERGVGNPTLRTLAKILAPFGLELGVRRRADRPGSRPVR
jgi:DNA-binding XRE family transcriptional regulator